MSFCLKKKKVVVCSSMRMLLTYQADFDAVHHEFEDILLKALLAGRWQGKECGRVWDRGGATLFWSWIP